MVSENLRAQAVFSLPAPLIGQQLDYTFLFDSPKFPVVFSQIVLRRQDLLISLFLYNGYVKGAPDTFPYF